MKDNGVWIPAFAGMTRKAEIASRRLAMTDGGRKRNPRQCWNAEETPGVKPGAKYKKSMDRGQERHDREESVFTAEIVTGDIEVWVWVRVRAIRNRGGAGTGFARFF